MAGNTTSYTLNTDDLSQSAAQSRRTRTILWYSLIVVDILTLTLSFIAGYFARDILPLFPRPTVQPSLTSYIPTLILQLFIVIAIFYFSRLYHQRRTFSRFDHARSIFGSITMGAVMTYGMQEFIFRNSVLYVNYPRSLFVYVWFFSIGLAFVGRELHRYAQNKLRENGIACDNLLIVGSGSIARDITGRIKNNPRLGYNIVGIVTDKEEHQGKMLGIPVLGIYPDLPDLIDSCHIEQVIIALPNAKRAELVELVTLCQRGQVDIKVYPDIFAYMAGEMNLDDLGGTPLLTVRDIALRGWKLSLKRGLDIFGALSGLIFLSPLFLLTALILWLEDHGPIFYTQIRMGLDGRPFPMVKFRSMRVDAESAGPGWTTENDPRVTRLGTFMRKSNWDEIPQLINVLLGHMSLVGPRPERPVYVQEFREHIPRYMERHREKAGMTGWAQVNGLRGDTSIAERTTFDLWYVENWSLLLDIKIIFWTVRQTISRSSRNAY
ncbi:MAG: undecaprenyl-phosphate glucose phosphotransferase [Aggregatilineales bacterium]